MRNLTASLLIIALLAGCSPSRSARPATAAPVPMAGLTSVPAASAPARVEPTRLPTARPTALPAPSPSPTAVPTESPPTATATPALVEGTPAPQLEGELVARTAHLDIYRLEHSVPVTRLLDLAPRFEEAIGRVGARIGGELTGRVAVRFEPPQSGPCAIRGLTMSHERTIRMFYGPETPPERLLAIAAHELAHQHQHDYYGWPAHRRSDTILLEGQATWASADYALGDDGRPEWQMRAEQALAAGELLPLAADLEADCRTATRNAAYTGWASFVAFLMTFGRERFDELYRSGSGRAPGAAGYASVYGKSLGELDQEWRAWLASRDG